MASTLHGVRDVDAVQGHLTLSLSPYRRRGDPPPRSLYRQVTGVGCRERTTGIAAGPLSLEGRGTG